MSTTATPPVRKPSLVRKLFGGGFLKKYKGKEPKKEAPKESKKKGGKETPDMKKSPNVAAPAKNTTVNSTQAVAETTGNKASEPSHALNLPNELFSQIFLQALPPLPTENPSFTTWFPSLEMYSHNLNTARLRLSQVCRRFRTVIHGTPSIWSPVALGRALKYDQALLQLQIERSGECPLDVFIRPKIWSGSKARVTALMKILQLQRHRIRCILVDMIYFEELQGLFPVDEPVVAMPLLETLIIRDYNPQYSAVEVEAPLHERFMGLVYAPKLNYMDVAEAVMIPRFLQTITLPNLTSVTLSSPKFHVSIDVMYSFLAICPNLKVLAFHRQSYQPMMDQETEAVKSPDYPLTLPHVTSLEFIADHTLDHMFLIRSLRLPSLTTLKFGYYGPLRQDISQFFAHFLVSQADTIESLHFTQHALAADDQLVAATLPTMRKLRRLVMEEVPLKSEVLKSLLPDPHDKTADWPCPKLRHLSLSQVEVEGDVLAKLVRARVPTHREWLAERKRKRQAKVAANEEKKEGGEVSKADSAGSKPLENRNDTVPLHAGSSPGAMGIPLHSIPEMPRATEISGGAESNITQMHNQSDVPEAQPIPATKVENIEITRGSLDQDASQKLSTPPGLDVAAVEHKYDTPQETTSAHSETILSVSNETAGPPQNAPEADALPDHPPAPTKGEVEPQEVTELVPQTSLSRPNQNAAEGNPSVSPDPLSPRTSSPQPQPGTEATVGQTNNPTLETNPEAGPSAPEAIPTPSGSAEAEVSPEESEAPADNTSQARSDSDAESAPGEADDADGAAEEDVDTASAHSVEAPVGNVDISDESSESDASSIRSYLSTTSLRSVEEEELATKVKLRTVFLTRCNITGISPRQSDRLEKKYSPSLRIYQ